MLLLTEIDVSEQGGYNIIRLEASTFGWDEVLNDTGIIPIDRRALRKGRPIVWAFFRLPLRSWPD